MIEAYLDGSLPATVLLEIPPHDRLSPDEAFLLAFLKVLPGAARPSRPRRAG